MHLLQSFTKNQTLGDLDNSGNDDNRENMGCNENNNCYDSCNNLKNTRNRYFSEYSEIRKRTKFEIKAINNLNIIHIKKSKPNIKTPSKELKELCLRAGEP